MSKKEMTREERIESVYNKLKCLNYIKDLPDDEIRAKAVASVNKKEAAAELQPAIDDSGINVDSLFTAKKEIRQAEELLKRYLKDFVPQTVSDKNNLRYLIYLEILQTRLQDQMNIMSGKKDISVPIQMIDGIHRNLNEINNVKEKLGLLGKEKQEEKTDAWKALEQKIARHKVWMKENQGSRTRACPHCSKMILWKIRPEMWISQKHPFFKDKILFNKHLVRLYLEEKLTREDVALVLEASSDYVDWLVDRVWRTNPDYQKIKEVAEDKESGK